MAVMTVSGMVWESNYRTGFFSDFFRAPVAIFIQAAPHHPCRYLYSVPDPWAESSTTVNGQEQVRVLSLLARPPRRCARRAAISPPPRRTVPRPRAGAGQGAPPPAPPAGLPQLSRVMWFATIPNTRPRQQSRS